MRHDSTPGKQKKARRAAFFPDEQMRSRQAPAFQREDGAVYTPYPMPPMNAYPPQYPLQEESAYAPFSYHEQGPDDKGSPLPPQGLPWQGVDEANDPWQADFTPADPGWYELDQFGQGMDDPVETSARQDSGQQPKKRRGTKASILAIALSLVVISICLISAGQAFGRQKGFEYKLAAMKGHAFFPGILIDGQAVSGQTPGQLRQHWQQDTATAQEINLQVIIDQTAFRLDSSHIPFERNREAVMEEAWSIGRQTHTSAIGASFTPFETRWRHVLHTQQNQAAFTTRVSYSPQTVNTLAESLAAQVNRDPVNAIVSAFDFRTKEFSVTQDVPGRQIAPLTIAQAITQALDRGDYQAVLPLQSQTLLPQVSSVDLKNSFTKLASFETKTTSDNDRNYNIALAAQAISNRTLMPGEVFSFNEATGQRTIQKGYRGAPAIQGGVLIDDVGGGVCQVSSTLFYAAAEAGMSIVDRSPHAWPVSYMDKGLDATVNWPNLDFKFRNDQDTPVFIIASYENRKLTVAFYGMLSAPGESIRLEAVVVSTQQPPRDPLMQANPSLPPFTQQELKPARTGYVVDTYRVYLRNGSEYRREKLFTSNYKMVQQVIEYN